MVGPVITGATTRLENPQVLLLSVVMRAKVRVLLDPKKTLGFLHLGIDGLDGLGVVPALHPLRDFLTQPGILHLLVLLLIWTQHDFSQLDVGLSAGQVVVDIRCPAIELLHLILQAVLSG